MLLQDDLLHRDDDDSEKEQSDITAIYSYGYRNTTMYSTTQDLVDLDNQSQSEQITHPPLS